MAEGAQRRSFVRVDDVFPLSYSPITREEYEEIKTQVLTKSASLHSLGSVDRVVEAAGRAVDPASPLWQALLLLDRKLDQVLRTLDALAAKDRPEARERAVNLSGSGLRFTSPEPFSQGQLLRMELRVPLAPPLHITCVAEVVQSKATPRGGAGDSDHWVAVRFVAMNREDREELTRYTFQRQRELLRVSRGGGEA